MPLIEEDNGSLTIADVPSVEEEASVVDEAPVVEEENI